MWIRRFFFYINTNLNIMNFVVTYSKEDFDKFIDENMNT